MTNGYPNCKPLKNKKFYLFMMTIMFVVWEYFWEMSFYLLLAHLLQWSFSLLFQFPREAGNYILIPAGMRVKCGKILYLNFIPKQWDFRPWIGFKMWKRQIFVKKAKISRKFGKWLPFPFYCIFDAYFFPNLKKFRQIFLRKRQILTIKLRKSI